MNLQALHQDIDNAERLRVIAEFPLERVMSAPGHHELRKPAAVASLAALISQGHAEPLFEKPIILWIFTAVQDEAVVLRSIECIDGHHRLLAGLVSGVWDRIGDLPETGTDTRVNGCRHDSAQPEDRWLPLDTVQRSTIPDSDYERVPAEWGAVGPTASISGTISGQSQRFAAQDRGVPFRKLANRWRYLMLTQ